VFINMTNNTGGDPANCVASSRANSPVFSRFQGDAVIPGGKCVVRDITTQRHTMSNIGTGGRTIVTYF